MLHRTGFSTCTPAQMMVDPALCSSFLDVPAVFELSKNKLRSTRSVLMPPVIVQPASRWTSDKSFVTSEDFTAAKSITTVKRALPPFHISEEPSSTTQCKSTDCGGLVGGEVCLVSQVGRSWLPHPLSSNLFQTPESREGSLRSRQLG